MPTRKPIPPERTGPGLVTIELDDLSEDAYRRVEAAARRYQKSMGEILEIVIEIGTNIDGTFVTPAEKNRRLLEMVKAKRIPPFEKKIRKKKS